MATWKSGKLSLAQRVTIILSWESGIPSLESGEMT
jgi:hypothetical protein